jgi:hypothetical protein
MILPLLLALLTQSFAATTTYTGTATKDGKHIYTEKHIVTSNDEGEVLEAKTSYLRVDGTVIATLSSDFKNSITNADHEMHDLRDDRRYGVRWKDKTPIMWDKKKDKKEETEELNSDYAKGKLLIGGQGLHYYMRTRLEELKKKELSIAILIPGQLDYYSFLVKFENEKKGLLKYSMKAQSAIIRLFAPKLEVWYTPDGKLMRYKGLSNVATDSGDNQNVEIVYTY